MDKKNGRALADAVERMRKTTPARAHQAPTHAQVVAAAWGNVAAENPKVTLGDARRAIKKARP